MKKSLAMTECLINLIRLTELHSQCQTATTQSQSRRRQTLTRLTAWNTIAKTLLAALTFTKLKTWPAQPTHSRLQHQKLTQTTHLTQTTKTTCFLATSLETADLFWEFITHLTCLIWLSAQTTWAKFRAWLLLAWASAETTARTPSSLAQLSHFLMAAWQRAIHSTAGKLFLAAWRFQTTASQCQQTLFQSKRFLKQTPIKSYIMETTVLLTAKTNMLSTSSLTQPLLFSTAQPQQVVRATHSLVGTLPQTEAAHLMQQMHLTLTQPLETLRFTLNGNQMSIRLCLTNKAERAEFQSSIMNIKWTIRLLFHSMQTKIWP